MGSGAGGALGRGRAGLSVASLDLVHSTNKASLRGRGAATGGDGGWAWEGTIRSRGGRGDAPSPPNLGIKTLFVFGVCVCLLSVRSVYIHHVGSLNLSSSSSVHATPQPRPHVNVFSSVLKPEDLSNGPSRQPCQNSSC